MNNRCYRCMRGVVVGGSCTTCGAKPKVYNEADRMRYLRPGSTLDEGKVLVGEVLGSGGMGVTYVAQDLESGKVVALKELCPFNMHIVRMGDKLQVPTEYAKVYSAIRSRFVSEAKLISKFNKHPHVVDVYFALEEKDKNAVYYAMEFLDGCDLKDWLKTDVGRDAVQDPDSFLKLMHPVMDAIAFVNDSNTIHRDIKPNNIIMRRNPNSPFGVEPVLIDFGAAHTDLIHFSKSLGEKTPAYAAPEQNSPSDMQGSFTDVYSFCVTMYECLCGCLLPSADDRLRGIAARKPDELNSAVSKKISAALMKGMELHTGKRLQSMDAFMQMVGLERLHLENGGMSAPKPQSEPEPAAPVQRAFLRAVNVYSVAPSELDPADMHPPGGRVLLAMLIDLLIGAIVFLPLELFLRDKNRLLYAIAAGIGAIWFTGSLTAALIGATPGQGVAGLSLRDNGQKPGVVKAVLYGFCRAILPVSLIDTLLTATGLLRQPLIEDALNMRLVKNQTDAPEGTAANDFELIMDRENRIGREPGWADFHLRDENDTASHMHCRIYWNGSGWVLTDTSTNGTVINGETVYHRQVNLRNRDNIHMGQEEFIFEIRQ